MYRPDTKQFAEITAIAPFATQAACDRARDAQIAANAKVVDALHANKETQFQADRIGPCHCDLTNDKSSTVYLSDQQRDMQLRLAEEIRLRVRERLLDRNIPSDSEAVRALYVDRDVTVQLGAPKFVPLPRAVATPVLTATEDLKSTKTLDTTKAPVAALDLPLVDIGVEPPPETKVAAEETVDPPAEDAEQVADAFVSYETQRIQNVLKAAGSLSDENLKARIFEACMQRIQLLSNLRLLIEGSGTRSKLAAAARSAQSEEQRVALITRLFGDEVRAHWAPKNTDDVIFDIDREVIASPERALRDTTGHFNAQQKKQALYLVLARTQPSEDQRLWLSAVVEEFLRL